MGRELDRQLIRRADAPGRPVCGWQWRAADRRFPGVLLGGRTQGDGAGHLVIREGPAV